MLDRNQFVRHFFANQRYFFVVLLLPIFLSACAFGPVTEEEARNIKRLGVISLLGNDFRIYDYGLTIFERRDRRRIEVPEWELEKTVQDAVRTALEANPRMTYVATQVDRDALKGIYGPGYQGWDYLERCPN